MSQPFKTWPPATFGLPTQSLPVHITPLLAADQPWDKVAGVLKPRPAPTASAVLMLFLPGKSAAEPAALLFTRRTTTVRSHKGQISFAGGRRDPQDASPAATALRELNEEVGAPLEAVAIAGMLPPIGALDGGGVYPVVGCATFTLATLRAAEAEVAEIFAAPWPSFTNAQAQAFTFNMFGNWRNSWSYATPQANIWGLTALILHSAALA